MSTYRASFKPFLNQGLSIQFKQNKSQVMIKCGKPITCNYPQSQTGLYLDISIRESSNSTSNWSSFQNHLKQLFDQLIQLQNYPNSTIKILLFILEEEEDIKSCIINGLWLLLVKLGINMKKSIFCLEKRQIKSQILEQNQNQIQAPLQKGVLQRLVYNLIDIQSIIQGQTHSRSQGINKLNQTVVEQEANKYRDFVKQTMMQTILN